jgi:hypothetical protein
MAKLPKLGSGKRFAALAAAARKQGMEDPEGFAAWRGRQKYGAARYAKMSAAGRRRVSK